MCPPKCGRHSMWSLTAPVNSNEAEGQWPLCTELMGHAFQVTLEGRVFRCFHQRCWDLQPCWKGERCRLWTRRRMWQLYFWKSKKTCNFVSPHCLNGVQGWKRKSRTTSLVFWNQENKKVYCFFCPQIAPIDLRIETMWLRRRVPKQNERSVEYESLVGKSRWAKRIHSWWVPCAFAKM